MRRSLTVLSAAALTVLLVPAVRAGEEEGERKQVRRVVVLEGAPAGAHLALAEKIADPAQIEGDHLKIEDLESLLPGESRSYFTDEGREVTVSRGEGERYTLEVAGKTIELGGELDELTAHAAAPHGARKIIIQRRHAGDPAGEAGDERVVEEDVIAIAGHALEGAASGDGPRPVVIEIVGEAAAGKVERRIIVLRLAEDEG